MKLDYARDGDVSILEFIGELDAFNLPPMAKAINEILERGENKLILDLKKLTFINSTGLGYLLQIRKKAAAAGGDMVLVQPSKFVRKVLATLGLDKVVRVYETEAAGLAHFRQEEITAVIDLADEEVDDSLSGENAILFTLQVGDRRRKFVGRITSLYANGLKFRWQIPGWTKTYRPPISTANFDKELHLGREIDVKFRQPFMVQGHYFECASKITSLDRITLDDGSDEGHFMIEYRNATEEDLKLLRRFVTDMELLRKELDDVTGSGRK